MPKPNPYFLLVDSSKNILLVDMTKVPEINDVIRKCGFENVVRNETVGELVAKIKRYLKGESVTEEPSSGETDDTTAL